jgi:predicted acetyltransferase
VTYDFRTATAEDWDEIARVLNDAFNDDFDEASAEVERAIFEPARTVVATQEGTVAGAASIFTRDLGVPGAVIPAAHVTMVGVGATHRRQGLLTHMIGLLHEGAGTLGESVAVLWASEGRIYQRFGYGLAARRVTMEAGTSEIAFLEPAEHAGTVRAVDAAAVDVFAPVFDTVRASRPGWSSRNEQWWAYVLDDTPSRRQGLGALRAVVHDGPSGVDGYLLWRVKGDWDDAGPNGTVHVRELIAANPVAYRALWQFALSVDLTRHARIGFAAPDEPLQFMVTEPRRLETRVSDALWVRILDLPAALTARRYAAPIDVVIEIDDPGIPANAGRWRLVGSPKSASCTRTDAPADVACNIRALGAAFLGGTALATLAAAGRLSELRAGTLAPASTAFSWHQAPSALEVF